jgi:hypothetical protein
MVNTGLKGWLRGHIKWHDFPPKFSRIILIGSTVAKGRQTHGEQMDKQNGDLITLTFFLRKLVQKQNRGGGQECEEDKEE